MAFYLRKAFRAGPLRINLSKSGLGVSAGVRGARIGVSGDGRSYVHGGRYGLYYRKYAGRGVPGNRGSADSVVTRGPIEVETDTGVTYSPRSVTSGEEVSAASLVSPAPALTPWLLGFSLLQIVLLPALLNARTAFIWILVLLAWGMPVTRKALRRRRARIFGERTIARLDAGRPLSDQEVSDLAAEFGRLKASTGELTRQARLIYLALIDAIVADREVTAQELSILAQVEKALAVDPSFCNAARRQAFQRAYLEAVSDHDLTEGEESTLTHLRHALGIPKEEIEEELQFLARLKDVREIRQGDIRPIDVDKPLQKSEQCYFRDVARKLKRKTIKTFQRAGQKYKVIGFEVEKEGELLVTSKRILLVHAGTTSIPHNKIIDLEVDCEKNVLVVTKDGARNPVYVTTPDALRAGAVIAAVAGI